MTETNALDPIRQAEVRQFLDTALSTEIKAELLATLFKASIVAEHPLIVAHGLMGAALDIIGDRDGLTGQMIYLRDVANQIEEALARPSGGAAN